MKKKIIYTDEPIEFGEIVPDNFLPSPEEFRRARLEKERVIVTLSLRKYVVEQVKKEAEKRKLHYKILLQSLISGYTQEKMNSPL